MPPDPRSILVVDVGGTNVKLLVGAEGEPDRFDSGPKLTPTRMVDGILGLSEQGSWDAVTLGLPTPIRGGRPLAEPVNLGKGWVGFDYGEAFGKPVRVVNDAVMQAVGSYEGGRMLFLGLGTGLGSALIVGGVVEPLELGHLPFRRKTFEDYVSNGAVKRLGKSRWRKAVFDVVEHLATALDPDYVVIGGGAVEHLDELPPKSRRGGNELAFVGGVRLWDEEWTPRTPVGDRLTGPGRGRIRRKR